MKIWEALVLGLVQGASEFLPISSSGHLLLLEKVGIGCEDMFFNIILHVSTLLAVIIALRKKWVPLLRRPFNKTNLNVVVACLPTVVLAVISKAFCPSLLGGDYLGAGFVLTAVLLYIGQNFNLHKSALVNAKTSILSGVLQGIAVLPGVSRSGATISALAFQGVKKEDATTFSFLLSIPIIIGSALYEGVDMALSKTPISISPWAIATGMISAFISGLISIKFFLKLVEKRSMTPFIIYTLLLGIAVSVLPFFTI